MSNNTFDQQVARIAVGGYEDAQEIRKSTMNRVRDLVRKKDQDIPFDEVEDEKDSSEKSYGDEYSDDELPELIEELMQEGKLSRRDRQYIQELMDAALHASELEQDFKDVMAVVRREPVWKEYLQYVNGVGVTLAARLIHRYGYCVERERVSEIWSYSGLAPGQKRRRGEKAGFDPQAKTLAWMVADCMIRQGDRSIYRREFYDPYKRKQLRRMERAEDMTETELQDVKWTPPESRGHADNRARRYLAKKFLKHYLVLARDMRGLETPDEWVLEHGGHEKETENFENAFYMQRKLWARSDDREVVEAEEGTN